MWWTLNTPGQTLHGEDWAGVAFAGGAGAGISLAQSVGEAVLLEGEEFNLMQLIQNYPKSTLCGLGAIAAGLSAWAEYQRKRGRDFVIGFKVEW